MSQNNANVRAFVHSFFTSGHHEGPGFGEI